MVAALRAADEVRMLRRGAVEFRGYPLAELSCHMLGAISEIDHLFGKLCERLHMLPVCPLSFAMVAYPRFKPSAKAV